jgi:hypothetical protein
MVYLITYDLNASGQNYQRLFETIRSLGEAIKPLQNLWFVDTAMGVTRVRAELQNVIDRNDNVFVAKVNSGEWDCYMPKSAIDWLQSRV